MKRTLMACAVIACGAGLAVAASPEVDKAIKTIQSVTADPAKLKLFCSLDDAEEAAGDKADEKQESAMDAIIEQLGPEFEAAWEVAEKLDEQSADGKEFASAMDAISDKCE